MSIFEGPITYVLIFIGFLVVVFFVTKFNQGLVDKSVDKANADDKMPDLANKMGLTYENLGTKPGEKKDKKEIFNIGSRVFGKYKGLDVEILMHSDVRESDKTPLYYSYSYSYSMQRTIKLAVSNTSNKKFHILPKDKNVVADPTGNSKFDENLVMTGDKIIPREVMDYFAGLEWMDLKLTGGKLVFNDTFYEQFRGMTGGMKMINAVHPIWGTSSKNLIMDINKVIEFVDMLVDLTNKASL